jgi:hypothetical protein
MKSLSSPTGLQLLVKGRIFSLHHKAPSCKTVERYAPSIGWQYDQIAKLIDTLSLISENFRKIAGISLSLALVINKLKENTVELGINPEQKIITVMLSRQLNPEETIEQIALEVGNELATFCVTHRVPGLSFNQIAIATESEDLKQIAEQIIASTILSKILFKLLPHHPPFIPAKYCRRENEKLMTNLMAKIAPLHAEISQIELLKFLANLAVFSIIEEKNGSNQIHREITARFTDDLGRELQLLGLAFNGSDANSEEFHNLYEQFRDTSQLAYDTTKITL